jgi:hypothetical protein
MMDDVECEALGGITGGGGGGTELLGKILHDLT